MDRVYGRNNKEFSNAQKNYAGKCKGWRPMEDMGTDARIILKRVSTT
jgi:hypothetical protein